MFGSFFFFFFQTGTELNEFAGYRACKCLKGFHRRHRFEGCKPCANQDGLKCNNESATLKTGYWWKWKNQTYKLLYEDFAKSLTNITYGPGKSINSSIINHSNIEFPHPLPTPYKCPIEESCNGGQDSSCATGYQGPLCAVCSPGYYKQLQTCQLCPTKTKMIVQLSVIAAVAAIVIAVIIWTSKRKSKKKKGRSSVDIILCRLKIVFGFYQVTNGVLDTFSYIKWPGSLEVIGKYSEILQMNVFQVAPIHCLWPDVKMNAFGNLFAILGMNSAVIFVSVLAYVIRKLYLLRSTLNKEQKEKKVAQTKELIYRNLFFFLFLTYLGTCSKTAQVIPLACRRLCLDEEDEKCEEYLRADYSINCDSQEYNRSVIVAYCAVFYIIFLPAASLKALWKQHKVPRRSLIHAKGEDLEPEEQAKGNVIHTENEHLEPQEQATRNVIHTENEDLEHQEQNTGNVIHGENEDLEHQKQNTANVIHAKNEALKPQEQATGDVIHAENEDLKPQEQVTGNVIHAENEDLEPQEQATGNVIHTENEDLEPQEQATGNIIHSENEVLESQEQATGIAMGLRFLFENYHSRAWYWEFVEMTRKVLLTSALIIVGGESRAYIGLALISSGIYVMLFAYTGPMADPFENRLMLSSLSVTLVNLAIGALSRIPQEGTPSSIDPYEDDITFNVLVFGANTLVITLLVGNY